MAESGVWVSTLSPVSGPHADADSGLSRGQIADPSEGFPGTRCPAAPVLFRVGPGKMEDAVSSSSLDGSRGHSSPDEGQVDVLLPQIARERFRPPPNPAGPRHPLPGGPPGVSGT